MNVLTANKQHRVVVSSRSQGVSGSRQRLRCQPLHERFFRISLNSTLSLNPPKDSFFQVFSYRVGVEVVDVDNSRRLTSRVRSQLSAGKHRQ